MTQKQLTLEQELETLYREHFQKLCLVASQFLDEPDQAKDAVQDFFINYWERRQQGIEAPQKFLAYARSSVRNLAIDVLRKQQRGEKHQKLFAEHVDITDDQDGLSRAEQYERRLLKVWELIQELPEGQREILKLHAMHKYTYAQIAAQRNVSVNTVRTQLTRAYRSLRESSKGLLFMIFLSRI